MLHKFSFLTISLLLLIFFILNCPAMAVQVAITVDDLPANGPQPVGIPPEIYSKQMIKALQKHGITKVYGFVNGEALKSAPEQREVLRAWTTSGQTLGNHTYSHMNLAQNTAEAFTEDIIKNEPILEEFSGRMDFRYFRFPYLEEGGSFLKRKAVRAFLKKNGYQMAPVTIDFGDWAWMEPYSRCLLATDHDSIQWLKDKYKEVSLAKLQEAQKVSHKLFNREIKQILLLHMGAFSSEMLDDLLSLLQKNGVTFISLADALKDPVYKQYPTLLHSTFGLTFLDQHMQEKGLDQSQRPTIPFDELDQKCRN